MFNKEEIANIILHVTLISTFIGIFFFTYGSYIEENIVKKQVNFLIEDNKEFVLLIPNDIKQKIVDKINNIKLDLAEDDRKAAEQNKKLLIKASKILAIGLIVGIAIVWKMSQMYNFNFMHLLKENLIILCFVALTEFSFLTFYAQQYLLIDPNIIRRRCITNIGDNTPQTNLNVNKEIEEVKKQLSQLNDKDLNLNNVLNETSIKNNINMFEKKYDEND
jgi:hypothetical protein